nr:hypothetical protein [Verrucomicrobiota bacterium]
IEGVLVAHNAAVPNESLQVVPASNQLSPEAQITQPLRNEPSEPISVPPELTAAIEPAPSPTAEESAAPEKTDEETAGALAAVEQAPSLEIAGEMPESPEPPPAPAKVVSHPVRKFDPHAKF